jgi:hypothetical protein
MSGALNGICPYFTMFPLDFPVRVLKRRGKKGQVVLDPFAGRGTTLYAGRLAGMKSYGIDSSPVATAISDAKLANTTPCRIVSAAKRVLDEVRRPDEIPSGDFWELAFHKNVLIDLCRLREGLLRNCRSESRKGLRALLLGALHGPRPKGDPSYLSNQCTRTYAPKPGYAAKFWRTRKLTPPKVDVLALVKRRAERYFGEEVPVGRGSVTLADSTHLSAFRRVSGKAAWVITSPPYFGMRTYLPDQWLRLWFLGGPSVIDYSIRRQLSHKSSEEFAGGLRKVWNNTARNCRDDARLVIRFGAINDRNVDSLELLKESFTETPWKIITACDAGFASKGRRQATHFAKDQEPALKEYDVWAALN